MPSICLCFHVHMPQWLRHYTFFDIGHDHRYHDREENVQILNELADVCYLPANTVIRDLIKKHRGKFRISFSVSGILLEQLEKHRRDVLDSFKRLSDTGCVEFINETYYHSLAALFSLREFKEQVLLHKKKIKTLFGQNPGTFRHTAFIYNNSLARAMEKMGYNTLLADVMVPGEMSANCVYQPADCRKLKILFRNHDLSHDLGFRFSDSTWSEYPLRADTYAGWIHTMHDKGNVINLFLDYEIFGKRHHEATGIFDFIRLLPREILKHPDFEFQTPAEIAKQRNPVAHVEGDGSDGGTDMSLWLGNALQKDAANTLYAMESNIRRRKDKRLFHTWRMLQESDHFYALRTKAVCDGDAQNDTNPYESPYDAYINFMNIMDDFSGVIGKKRSVVHEKQQ